jgi:hypothetical protein
MYHAKWHRSSRGWFFRRRFILGAALEIESDLFWTSLTTPGYREWFSQLAKALKELTIQSSWTWDLERKTGDVKIDDLVGCLKRAARVYKVRKEVGGRKGGWDGSSDSDREDDGGYS